MKLSPRILALALAGMVSSCAQNDRLTSVTPPATPVFDLSQNLPLVFDVENTGANIATTVPTFNQSPSNLILPDPFRSFNGNIDVTFAGWERHRAEVKAAIETDEIGPKPSPSDLTETATFAANTLSVVVTRKSNGRSITFKSPVFLPSGTGPFPAVIGMTWICFPPFFPCTGTGSLPTDIFTSRNIARIPYFHDQATTYIDFSGAGHANDPFFRLYPEYSVGEGNVGQYTAWAWGVSRLIDGIQIAARQGSLPIDVSHLAVTGCSYAGKMALYAGALDERVALTIAQESGGGGMPAWRVSEAIGDPRDAVEHIDNTNYTWFAHQMRQFSGTNVYKLPEDHHQLMAMVAPRALLATNNYDYIWLSNPAAWVSARAAQEAYRQLGVSDRFGYIDDGSVTGNAHNHCSVPASQLPAISAFVDKFLLGQDVDTNIAAAHVSPYTDAEVDSRGWMPWALRNDIAQLVDQGTLTADQGAGLTDKVNAFVGSISSAQLTPARNQMNAFLNQVSAFVGNGKLTQAQADVLVGKINATKTRLGL